MAQTRHDRLPGTGQRGVAGGSVDLRAWVEDRVRRWYGQNVVNLAFY